MGLDGLMVVFVVLHQSLVLWLLFDGVVTFLRDLLEFEVEARLDGGLRGLSIEFQ